MQIDGLTPSEPTLESIEEIISCAERRVKRAGLRLERAQEELGGAAAALVRAREDKAAWLLANPQDQLEMFE
ncbi:hypothetical protein [Novosphingobium sediminicola]|uniref:Uncharacterized protein n=1 Tax=Novosphingobium sediminicola TaxID=563162 RepID=A0A7W6G809_9SPHN|nr:hypothetical protein [Novosphingobium sediminicola]MBB3956861.1 hypothetical protein [Novosphingobium sediminicola]